MNLKSSHNFWTISDKKDHTVTVPALAIFGVYCNKTANDDVNYATFFKSPSVHCAKDS